VPLVLAQLLVVQPAELVRVMVKPVGGALHLVEVMAVIAGGRRRGRVRGRRPRAVPFRNSVFLSNHARRKALLTMGIRDIALLASRAAPAPTETGTAEADAR